MEMPDKLVIEQLKTKSRGCNMTVRTTKRRMTNLQKDVRNLHLVNQLEPKGYSPRRYTPKHKHT